MGNPNFNTKIHYWIRTKYDSRDCAGGCGCLMCAQKTALSLARRIDRNGQSSIDTAIEDGDAEHLYIPDEGECVPGHGVNIEYPSGRCRTVHE
jgi:hypothetical protein